MQRIKDFLSLIALIVLGGISVAAVVQAMRQELPAAKAEPVDLTWWLTERNLQVETRETKSKLAQQLDAELSSQRDWTKELEDLDDRRRKQLEQNFVQLLEVWYVDKVNQYFSRPEAQRVAYLDGELDKISTWIERRLPREASSSLPVPSAVAGFALINPRIQAWVDQADPAMQPRMREFQMAVQNRLISRELQKALRD